MLFNRTRNYSFPPEFSLGNQDTLEVKREHKILGVIVQDGLRWQAQVEHMVRRASNTIWVLRRMKALGVDQDCLNFASQLTGDF